MNNWAAVASFCCLLRGPFLLWRMHGLACVQRQQSSSRKVYFRIVEAARRPAQVGYIFLEDNGYASKRKAFHNAMRCTLLTQRQVKNFKTNFTGSRPFHDIIRISILPRNAAICLHHEQNKIITKFGRFLSNQPAEAPFVVTKDMIQHVDCDNLLGLKRQLHLHQAANV